MGLAEMTQTHAWKNFMAKLYGLGASVVIIGALFKIMHWPGAGPMLTVGLLTEAVIFFFSAFEPLHEEDDWSLVFPILGGAGKADEIPVELPEAVGGTLGETRTGRPELEVKKSKALESDAMLKFNEMLDKANEKGIFETFGASLTNLNERVSQLSDISDATLATNEYTGSMKKAAGTVESFTTSYSKSSASVTESAEQLASSYKQSADTLNYSVENLADTYNKASQKAGESSEELVGSYKRLTQSMQLDFSELKDGNKVYGEQVASLNKNLSALNAIFELQLNEADLDKMMDDLNKSVEESNKYATQVTRLRENLQSLNTIYGNMLAAMQYKG